MATNWFKRAIQVRIERMEMKSLLTKTHYFWASMHFVELYSEAEFYIPGLHCLLWHFSLSLLSFFFLVSFTSSIGAFPFHDSPAPSLVVHLSPPTRPPFSLSNAVFASPLPNLLSILLARVLR